MTCYQVHRLEHWVDSAGRGVNYCVQRGENEIWVSYTHSWGKIHFTPPPPSPPQELQCMLVQHRVNVGLFLRRWPSFDLPFHQQKSTVCSMPYILLCKAKRQYLLTCKVSRYCLLALHGSIQVRRHCKLSPSLIYVLYHYRAEILLYKLRRPKGFFQFKIIMNVLVYLPSSFEYL